MVTLVNLELSKSFKGSQELEIHRRKIMCGGIVQGGEDVIYDGKSRFREGFQNKASLVG